MKKALYICFEGIEGTGKGTQIELLKKRLSNEKVLYTKEPGTERVPLTLKIRELILNKKYENIIDDYSRELFLQAVRSIHLSYDIIPNLSAFDYIIQDRGLMSGYAYGYQNFSEDDIDTLNHNTIKNCWNKQVTHPFEIYDLVIYFQANESSHFLEKAKNAKQEFKEGDIIEERGSSFMDNVLASYNSLSLKFNNIKTIILNKENGERKSPDEIHQEVFKIINDYRN